MVFFISWIILRFFSPIKLYGWSPFVGIIFYAIGLLPLLMFILFTFNAINFSLKAKKKDKPGVFLSLMVFINSIISISICFSLIETAINWAPLGINGQSKLSVLLFLGHFLCFLRLLMYYSWKIQSSLNRTIRFSLIFFLLYN